MLLNSTYPIATFKALNKGWLIKAWIIKWYFWVTVTVKIWKNTTKWWFSMNVDEFEYIFLDNYRELEQLWPSSMIPELQAFDLEH